MAPQCSGLHHCSARERLLLQLQPESQIILGIVLGMASSVKTDKLNMCSFLLLWPLLNKRSDKSSISFFN